MTRSTALGSMLAVALSVAACGSTKGPEQATRSYLDAIAASNAKAACALSTESFQRQTTYFGPAARSCEESLSKYAQRLGKSGRTRLQQTPLTTKQTTDWAWVRTGYGDQYTLRKVGDAWLIDSAAHP